MPAHNNDARSDLTVLSGALLAAAALIAATAALKFLPVGAPWRLLIALLPVPAYVFFVVTQVRAVGRLDELQQRIQLEGLVIAFPTTFIAILTTWLLHTAGLLPGVDLSDAILFFLLFMIFMHVASRWVARSRYR